MHMGEREYRVCVCVCVFYALCRARKFIQCRLQNIFMCEGAVGNTGAELLYMSHCMFTWVQRWEVTEDIYSSAACPIQIIHTT